MFTLGIIWGERERETGRGVASSPIEEATPRVSFGGRPAARRDRFIYLANASRVVVFARPNPPARSLFRGRRSYGGGRRTRRNGEKMVGGNGTFIETLSGDQEHEEAIRHSPLPLYECRSAAASNCGGPSARPVFGAISPASFLRSTRASARLYGRIDRGGEGGV